MTKSKKPKTTAAEKAIEKAGNAEVEELQAKALERAVIAVKTYESFIAELEAAGEAARATHIERALRTYAEQAAEAVVNVTGQLDSFEVPEKLDHFEETDHDVEVAALDLRAGRGRFKASKNKKFLKTHKGNVDGLKKALGRHVKAGTK